MTANSGAWPLVSVVLPVRNEAGHIAACVGSVLAQDYPGDRLEVLVVDGASEDDTPRIVARLAEADPRVRLFSNPKRIVPAAMNVGIRAARGAVIARVDGHTRIAPDYIRIGVETLERAGAAAVGGPMRPVGGTPFGDAVARAMCSRFGIGAYFHFGTEEREVDTVYMGMWPRRVFEEVGLFDEEFVRNQDDELSYRIRKRGGRIVLEPRMRSAYQNRQTPAGLWRQFYEYGLWKVRVLQRHPRQMSWRHFVPPAFVGGVAAGLGAAVALPAAGAAAAALLGLYGAAALGVAARAAPAGGIGPWLRTAGAFGIMHVAWGSGFLAGLLRFAGGWTEGGEPPRLAAEESRPAAD